KKTDPKLRRPLIKRRSIDVRCRVWQRGVHTGHWKPAWAEKHARAQAESSDSARFIAAARIESSKRSEIPIGRNIAVTAENAIEALPEIGNDHDIGLSSPVPALIHASHSPISLEAPKFGIGFLGDPALLDGNYVGFNFAAFTPALPPGDRQVYYGSFTRDICDKYLTVFADFKIARSFFDSSLAAVPFTPDPF